MAIAVGRRVIGVAAQLKALGHLDGEVENRLAQLRLVFIDEILITQCTIYKCRLLTEFVYLL